MGRQLLAFKRAPTVELQLDNFHVEVREHRVVLSAGGENIEWFSWEVWRDFARRVEHSISWVESNTPEDVTGSSFQIDEEAP